MTREYQEVSRSEAVDIGSFSPESHFKCIICSFWRLCKSWTSRGWKSPVKTKTRRTQKFPTWSSWETKRAISVRSCFSAFCVWTTEQSTETNKSCWWCSFVQVRLGGRNTIDLKKFIIFETSNKVQSKLFQIWRSNLEWQILSQRHLWQFGKHCRHRGSWGI